MYYKKSRPGIATLQWCDVFTQKFMEITTIHPFDIKEEFTLENRINNG